jgi:predicted permease
VLVALLLSFAPRVGSEHRLGAELTAGSTRTSTGSGRRRRLQQVLVVAQVGVSVILLTGAGLLVQSMKRIAAVDPGLDTKNVLTMEVPADFAAITSREKTIQTYERMATELKAIPGVQVVGLGSNVPLRVTEFQLDIKAEGRVQNPGEPQPQAEFRTADPGYFKASGMRLAAGRDFTTADSDTSERVAIVNQTLAKLLFPGENAVGRRVTWTGEVLKFIGLKEDWMTIVGVVADTKDGGLDAAPARAIYTPFRQGVFPTGSLVLRTEVNPSGLAQAAREIVRSVDPRQPIEKLMPLDAIRDESVGPRRINAMLIGSFSMLALVIAAIGIAAVLAFSVSARTNEIGIRMSLGADSGMVQRMVLAEGGVLLAGGVVLGVAGAFVTTRFIQGLLYGVAPDDPVTVAGVSALMAVVGLGACWIPARRAAKIDPQAAMRQK